MDVIVLEQLYPHFDPTRRGELIKEVNEHIRAKEPEYVNLFHSYQTALHQLTVPASTVFIIEEPEQNLFPYTQLEIIETMVKLCTGARNHGFTVTTHSPYIINLLNILIARYYKGAEETRIDPEELNVFSVQDGRLINQMQFNSATEHSSVNVDELTEAMQAMYNEYRELKRT